MSKIEKKIPQWGFYGHRNSKVDLAGFEKVDDDKYVFTKKNFWGFEDFSKRYSLNESERNKILKSYRWCWSTIGIILFLFVFGLRFGSSSIGCDVISKWFCREYCIGSFVPLFLVIFYRSFVIYNVSKIKSKYPAYTGKTTILYKKGYIVYGIIFITLMVSITTVTGIKCIIN